MRRTTFWGIIIGTGLYQLGRIALGYSPTYDTWFDAVYWSGAALALHWLQNRKTHNAV